MLFFFTKLLIILVEFEDYEEEFAEQYPPPSYENFDE